MSIADCELGLTMSQTNLLKLDRVQNEAKRVILGTTKDTPHETLQFMLDLPLVQTRQTESETGQSILHCCRKSPQPTPWRHERHKRMQTWAGKSWMGQAEESIQLSSYTSWQSSRNPRSGKGTQTDSDTCTRHSCQKTQEGTLSQEWLAGKIIQTIRVHASH